MVSLRLFSLYIFECALMQKYKLSRTKFIVSLSILKFSGDNDMEEIPVPIPNTEVKLQCAEDICGLPC